MAASHREVWPMLDVTSKRSHARLFEKAIVKAWGEASAKFLKEQSIAPDHDRKLRLSYSKVLKDTDGQLALGYLMKPHREGRPFIMQADIVNALAEENASKPEKKRIRQSISRRMAALEYFGLARVESLTQTAVSLAVTEVGVALDNDYDVIFARMASELNLVIEGVMQ